MNTAVQRESGAILEREYGSRKLGVLLAAAVSLVTLVLSLPFVKWINLVNTETLYKSFKLKADAIAQLDSGYTLYNMLSFVQISKRGILGLYAMILLLMIAITLYFHAVFLVKALIKRYGKKGLLGLYSTGQAAMVFNILTCAAAIGFVIFANKQFGMTGFVLSWVVYLLPIPAMAAYIIIKMMEAKERILSREHGFLTELKRNAVLFVFLIPCFMFFIINCYLPMIGVYFAFTQFNFRDGLFASPFVGFKNFEFLLKADLFRLTRNTIIYNLFFIGIGNIAQIFFAILVSRVASRWFKKASQTLIFMPYFVSYVILKVLVYNIFEFEFGLINSSFASIGLDKIDFYNNPSYWPFFITAFYLWKNLGYGMVIYLASIMGISDDYYDAAKVDGANVFQQIRYITLPLLTPTFIILLLYALGSIMKGQFELFYQIIGNNGVLFNATDIFDTYVYRITTTQPLNMGLGTAAGLYQSIFGLAVVMLTNFLIKRKNPEYALF